MEQAPVDALTLAAVAAGAGGGDRAAADLSGIWALPAEMAATRRTNVTRTLSGGGELAAAGAARPTVDVRQRGGSGQGALGPGRGTRAPDGS